MLARPADFLSHDRSRTGSSQRPANVSLSANPCPGTFAERLFTTYTAPSVLLNGRPPRYSNYAGGDYMPTRIETADRADILRNQPFSLDSAAKGSRLRGATKVESVCPYCAVGCS